MAINNNLQSNSQLVPQQIVTVIVPIYNVERYLGKCIESIINQTYQNLQILLVNDGSTDHCGKICDDFAAKDLRITVYHTSNQGQSNARNVGLAAAHGKYVSFIDADDWIDSDFYEKMSAHGEHHQLDMCVCSRKSVDDEGNVSLLSVKDSADVFQSIDHYFSNYFFQPFTPSSCNKLYLRKHIIDHSIRFQSVSYVGTEDTLFNFAFLLYGIKIGSVDKVYYNQVIRKGSTALTYKKGIMLRTKNLVAECYKLLKNENKYDEAHNAAIAYLFLYFFNYNIAQIKHHFNTDEMKIVKEEIQLIKNSPIIRRFALEILKNKKLTELLKRKGYQKSGLVATKVLYASIYCGLYPLTIKFLQKTFKLN